VLRLVNNNDDKDIPDQQNGKDQAVSNRTSNFFCFRTQRTGAARFIDRRIHDCQLSDRFLTNVLVS